VLDPSQGIDDIADIGVRDGRIAWLGEPGAQASEAAAQIDASGLLVVPGLVDLHTHCYWGGTPLGVNADKIGPATGVTSWVDTGSAGAGNFEGFYHHVIRRSTVRIYPLLHVSYIGLLVVGGTGIGELFDFRHLNLSEVLRIGEAYRHSIRGIKVRASINATGPHSSMALRCAREAADALEVPLMVHVGGPPPFLDDVLPFLRSGDVVTHCFTPFHGGVVDESFAVRPVAREARARGVLFDVGHGGGSFSFSVAEAALDQGFYPDTISTDLHSKCIAAPVVDLPTTIAKFLALGVDLAEAIDKTTHRPAQAYGLDAGTLRPGAPADIALFSIERRETRLVDAAGLERTGSTALVPRGTIVGGEVVHPAQDDRSEVFQGSTIPKSRSRERPQHDLEKG
jgi:dihydroorotase